MIVGLRKICKPAEFYLVISLLMLFVMGVQNYYSDFYCIGPYSCDVNVFFMFLLKFIYVIFWTWLLNIICKAGYSGISWFLVLIPYILLFTMLLFFFSIN